jgi:hypothetical protein
MGKMMNSKHKGVFKMNAGELNLAVDDYLDLYLVAGKLDDQKWQQEIIAKLHNFGNNGVN